MIVDIKYKSTVNHVINYHFSKIEKGKATLLETTFNADSKEDLISNYNLQASLNTKIKNKFIHLSLSPNPKDNLSQDDFLKIAHTYIEKMNLENRPYFIVEHSDSSNKHFHIVTTSVDDHGKSYNAFNNFQKNKKACQEIEVLYNLTKTLEKVEYKKMSLNEKNNLKYSYLNLINSHKNIENHSTISQFEIKHIKQNRLNNYQIENYLGREKFLELTLFIDPKLELQKYDKLKTETILENALLKGNSLEEYIQILKTHNIKARFIINKGKTYIGYKDENTGNYFDEKKLAPEFSFHNLYQQNMSDSFFKYKTEKVISLLMKKETNILTFQMNLKKEGFELIYSDNNYEIVNTKNKKQSIKLDNLIINKYDKNTKFSISTIYESLAKNQLNEVNKFEYQQMKNKYEQEKNKHLQLNKNPLSFITGNDQTEDNLQKKRKKKFDSEQNNDIN